MTTTLTTDTTTTSTTATTKSSKTRISSNSISLNENPSKKETPLVISTHHQYQKERMNQTIGNEPPEIAKNMEMSKFKALHKLDVILEQLQSKRIRRFKSPKTLNTYYIPWIISNFQNSTDIKNDPELKEDLKHLMMKYKEWNPKSKSFKLLKHRLAPIQEIFRMAGITFTLEDQIKLNQQKQQRQQQQEQQQQEQTQLKHSMNFEDEQNALQEINSILYKEGKA
ncbi:hypothetical protein BCR32DRAFT_136086 [Anaeromyces robustus]|uniref:Uncharacterized protein n=1 Tax=Anaeromyces robustus TaxID=1754192 RepID=A0A1Y1VR03_9FUNG|nr:hypothetical protein BCR32DRAFT_136086 [Anaeromyces robustus]|eukprot:ORX63718.1 hypothetical protein BCR32DRAFT_136086 [Anaeromyces robustus]